MTFDLKGELKMEPTVWFLYSMIDGNFQRLKSIVGGMLEVLLRDYDEVMMMMMMKSLCEQKDTQLNQAVEYENGNKATGQLGIWHMADHSSYHQAHINQL